MEEKVLLNVLLHVRRGASVWEFAPDRAYVYALATIGLIRLEWDVELTDFGRSMITHLQSRLV